MKDLVKAFKAQNKKNSSIDWKEIDSALLEIVGEVDFKVFDKVNKIRLQLIKLAKEEEA